MAQLIDMADVISAIEALEARNNCGTYDFIEAKSIAYKQVREAVNALEVKEEAFIENTQQLIGSYTTEVETGDGGIKALVRKELRAPTMDYEKKIREYMNSSKLYKDILSILFPELTVFEPKFKVGDWICNGRYSKLIVGIQNSYYQFKDGTTKYIDETDAKYHLWTIQDAKDGDVLYTPKGCGVEGIFLIEGWKQIDDTGRTLCSNIGYRVEDDEIIAGGLGAIWWEGVIDPFYPATKEQRDLLFQKMKEAGYEWDAEKKKLRKCEQKHSIDINKMVDDYANSSERGNEEFGKPVPCMIRAYRQGLNDAIGKVVREPWSEEDECYMAECINAIATKDGWSFEEKRNTKHWLKSLKDRIHPQPKQEWSEEDEDILNEVIRHFDGIPLKHPMHKVIGWLVFIKQRIKD